MQHALVMCAAAVFLAIGTAGHAGNQTHREPAGQAENDGLFLDAQGDRDRLATSILGRNVRDRTGAPLGVVSDIILHEDGALKGVLIGVGGLLGIGAKIVGVPFSALAFEEREVQAPAPRGPQDRGASPAVAPEGSRHTLIMLHRTADQLQAAPAYVRARDPLVGRP